jgi:hypothetical protein
MFNSMQFINYFFASIISFLGLLIGIALIKIAPEEQIPMKRWFRTSKKIIVTLIFSLLIFYFYNKIFYILVILAYLAFVLAIEAKIDNDFKKSMVIYTTFGILFFVSQENANLFVMESSLIMLFGLPTASLLYDKKEKNYFKVMLNNLGFLIIANLLYFT